MAVEVNEELCVGCVDVCPVEALAMKKNNKVGCDADKCIDCGQCVNECPEGALSL
ncbi:MAG: 4Fe-4S binding protein [Thermoplasmata archaeon]